MSDRTENIGSKNTGDAVNDAVNDAENESVSHAVNDMVSGVPSHDEADDKHKGIDNFTDDSCANDFTDAREKGSKVRDVIIYAGIGLLSIALLVVVGLAIGPKQGANGARQLGQGNVDTSNYLEIGAGLGGASGGSCCSGVDGQQSTACQQSAPTQQTEKSSGNVSGAIAVPRQIEKSAGGVSDIGTTPQQIEKAAVAWYAAKYGDNKVTAVFQDFGCHQQVSIKKGEKVVLDLAYNNGGFEPL